MIKVCPCDKIKVYTPEFGDFLHDYSKCEDCEVTHMRDQLTAMMAEVERLKAEPSEYFQPCAHDCVRGPMGGENGDYKAECPVDCVVKKYDALQARIEGAEVWWAREVYGVYKNIHPYEHWIDEKIKMKGGEKYPVRVIRDEESEG
jgi:hypothetical protein